MALNASTPSWKGFESCSFHHCIALSLSLQETGNAFKWRSLYEELWSFSIKRIFLKAPKEFRYSLMTFPKQTWQLYGIIFHVNWFSIFFNVLETYQEQIRRKKNYDKFANKIYQMNCCELFVQLSANKFSLSVIFHRMTSLLADASSWKNKTFVQHGRCSTF